MKIQFVIIDLRYMDFMKDKEGKIDYYNTEIEASVCECTNLKTLG
jgi:hypothetical protein